MPTLTLSGGLDISRYPEIADVFANCPEGGDCVVVDLSRATWIDSVFMTELLLFHRRNQKDGRPIIVVARGDVARLLVVAGIDARIRIVTDLDQVSQVAPGLEGGSTPQQRRSAT